MHSRQIICCSHLNIIMSCECTCKLAGLVPSHSSPSAQGDGVEEEDLASDCANDEIEETDTCDIELTSHCEHVLVSMCGIPCNTSVVCKLIDHYCTNHGLTLESGDIQFTKSYSAHDPVQDSVSGSCSHSHSALLLSCTVCILVKVDIQHTEAVWNLEEAFEGAHVLSKKIIHNGGEDISIMSICDQCEA